MIHANGNGFCHRSSTFSCLLYTSKLFPQGYAAILQHSDLLNEPSVILADIGGSTVDIMRLDNRIPYAASCRSLELGMIRCLDEIAEQVRRSLNLSLTGAQIENVLRGSPDSMDAVSYTHLDVYKRQAWYAEAVTAAVDNGLLYGKSKTQLDPNGRCV